MVSEHIGSYKHASSLHRLPCQICLSWSNRRKIHLEIHPIMGPLKVTHRVDQYHLLSIIDSNELCVYLIPFQRELMTLVKNAVEGLTIGIL